MTTISGLPPIRPPGPQDPTITPGKTPTTATATNATPTSPTALGVDTVAYDAIVAMVARAIASLPPGTALSSFFQTVARVTAEVEAQLAAPPKPGDPATGSPGLSPSPAPTATTAAVPLPEAVALRLAAALAADPVAARAAMLDPAQPSPATPAEVSARDLALAAAAMLGGRVDPRRSPADDLSPIATDPDRDRTLSEQPMRDRLYLLDPSFADPAYPDRTFYCRDCITVDGLLARFPDHASTLEIVRVPYPRPRGVVVDIIGTGNQNLPVLVLAPGADPALADGRHDGVYFVAGFKALLHALHVRHGFPEAHP